MRRFSSVEKSDNGSYIRAMNDNSNIRLRERSNTDTSYKLNFVPNEEEECMVTSRFMKSISHIGKENESLGKEMDLEESKESHRIVNQQNEIEVELIDDDQFYNQNDSIHHLRGKSQ